MSNPVLTVNTALNGLEIAFPGRPDRDTLDRLKAHGFRWHNQKKLWYAKSTPARKAFAGLICLTDIPAGVVEDVHQPRQSRPEPVNAYGVKVGDIFYESFGYSMTIVHFYQVTKILGAKKIEIRQICSKVDHSSIGGTDYVIADPNNFCGDPIQKIVQQNRYGGGIYLKIDHSSATPWSGSPVYENRWD